MEKKKSTDTLLTFLIITLFVFSVLLLVIAGIKSYKSVSETAENNTELRSSLVYISNKLKSGDSVGSVKLKEEGTTQVLSIKREISGETYEDCIYCYNGAIYEQLLAPGDVLDFGNGDFITKISSLNIEENGGLFKITAKTQSGIKRETFLNLRSEGKA